MARNNDICNMQKVRTMMNTTKNEIYDPSIFEEAHIIENRGIIGWLAKRRVRAILDLCKNFTNTQEKIKIIDIGCGYGEILAELAEAFPNAELTGVDINEAAIDEACQRVPKALFFQKNLESATLIENHEKYDLVICSEVLEHVNSPQLLANKLIEITKSDGYICVTVPNDFITNIGRFILRKKPYKSPAHKTAFTEKKLISVFSGILPMEIKTVPMRLLPFFMSTNIAAIFWNNNKKRIHF